MRGKTHVLSGFILGTALCTRLDVPAPIMISCMFGSLFPDTDHRQSLLGRGIPLWLFIKPHRKNILHSLAGMGIMSLIWALITMSWVHAVGLAAGYLAHLTLDTMTKKGIPWLWPDKRSFSLWTYVKGASELKILFIFYTIVITTISVL